LPAGKTDLEFQGEARADASGLHRLCDRPKRAGQIAKSESVGKLPRSTFLTGKSAAMPRVCYFTGKKTTFGNQKTHRGKAKYLGGVGTKVTGITPRKFKPNIQKVRAVVNGRVTRIKVSAKALRMGLVVKPVKRRYTKSAAA
jgi:large subunit ribosomal protein L28